MAYKADMKINKGKFFFLSTTRSKSDGFLKDRPGSVRIKLDGRKLSQRYKGFAIDYWGGLDRFNMEMEDRIVLDKPYIDNAIDYILEISILNSENMEESIKSVLRLCQKNNIPVFVYDDVSDFAMNIKNNALKLNYLNGYEGFYGRDASETNNELNDPSDEKILKLISHKNPDVLSNYGERTKENVGNIDIKITDYYDLRDYANDIKRYLKRIKINTQLIEDLVKDMKKYKTRNIDEYITKKIK